MGSKTEDRKLGSMLMQRPREEYGESGGEG